MHKEIVYIKNHLPEYMKSNGIGFKELSDKTHVSGMTIGEIYRQGLEDYKPKRNDYCPSVMVAMLISYAFDVSVDDMFYPCRYVCD